jgi:DNA-binding response OmpR family regulator
MHPLRTHHLLVADDDPDSLAAYVQYFQLHGYEVRASQDGAEALTEYFRWLPALVILDVQMPKLDGRAVAREIRRLTRRSAPLLVAVSGLTAPSEKTESLSSGFDHHFAKPADLSVILAVVTSHSRIGDPYIAEIQSRY